MYISNPFANGTKQIPLDCPQIVWTFVDMKPFTKLFASIVSSSIWRSSKETKIVWVTMLAMADKEGEVWASVGGLADMARITKEECRKALDELLLPDDDSRTTEHEGRRIERVDGGWRVLNYVKYRDLGRGEERREYFAEHKRIARALCPQMSTMSTTCPPLSPIAEAEADKREGEERARAPLSESEKDEERRSVLLALGAKIIKGDDDLLPEWKAVTKGLKRSVVEEVFKEAKPGILWPSEFKAARIARARQ